MYSCTLGHVYLDTSDLYYYTVFVTYEAVKFTVNCSVCSTLYGEFSGFSFLQNLVADYYRGLCWVISLQRQQMLKI